MLFNSIEFIPFLLIVGLAHWLLLPRRAEGARKLLLVVASYVFYMSWNPYFGFLLLFSTLLDFTLALAMKSSASEWRRRALLCTSLVANLGLLGFFKYGGFLASNWQSLFATPDLEGTGLGVFMDIALPVGISFYTFQTLSYTIEVYRGHQEPTSSLLDFALYICFFPQLVAGPIVRPSGFLPQIERPREISSDDLEYGVMRVAIGLFKKVVLADTLGLLVDPLFATPTRVDGLILLLGIYAYAYQIYFDFSGYSDIAIGLARFFGIRLPENFDRPYLATSPRDFWQRWHISLSTWLRDYLYISLGGSRGRAVATARNLMVTMLLGGLWHGAGWSFIAWGAYHGALLVGQRAIFGAREPGEGWLPKPIRQIATFHLVCFGWLLFRAPTLEQAWRYLSSFPGGRFVVTKSVLLAFVALVIGVGLQCSTDPDRLRSRLLALPPSVQGALYAGVAIMIFLFSTAGTRFIYFQF